MKMTDMAEIGQPSSTPLGRQGPDKVHVMGRSSKKQLNPADAQRRQDRKRQVQKNKKNRAQFREQSLKLRSVEKIDEELEDIQRKERMGRADEKLLHRKKALEGARIEAAKLEKEQAERRSRQAKEAPVHIKGLSSIFGGSKKRKSNRVDENGHSLDDDEDDDKDKGGKYTEIPGAARHKRRRQEDGDEGNDDDDDDEEDDDDSDDDDEDEDEDDGEDADGGGEGKRGEAKKGDEEDEDESTIYEFDDTMLDVPKATEDAAVSLDESKAATEAPGIGVPVKDGLPKEEILLEDPPGLMRPPPFFLHQYTQMQQGRAGSGSAPSSHEGPLPFGAQSMPGAGRAFAPPPPPPPQPHLLGMGRGLPPPVLQQQQPRHPSQPQPQSTQPLQQSSVVAAAPQPPQPPVLATASVKVAAGFVPASLMARSRPVAPVAKPKTTGKPMTGRVASKINSAPDVAVDMVLSSSTETRRPRLRDVDVATEGTHAPQPQQHLQESSASSTSKSSVSLSHSSSSSSSSSSAADVDAFMREMAALGAL